MVVDDSIDASDPSHVEMATLALFNALSDIEPSVFFAATLCCSLFKLFPFVENRSKLFLVIMLDHVQLVPQLFGDVAHHPPIWRSLRTPHVI